VRHCLVSRRRERSQRGAITVEFALIFPAIVAILFAIIDAGRFVGARVMLTQAVSAGARTAALSTTTTTGAVDTAVHAAAPMLNGLTVTAVQCTLTNTAVPCASFGAKANGDRVTVSANYVFDPIFFNAFAKTLTQSSWTVVEW
jgi:Flp pilus assembly protein TadG